MAISHLGPDRLECFLHLSLVCFPGAEEARGEQQRAVPSRRLCLPGKIP